MGKNKDIDKIINLLSVALRHKIGSIVNKDEIYAGKYAKDADIILREAKIHIQKYNWNLSDKEKMKNQLTKKLQKELSEKDFLDSKKFDIMDDEIKKLLKNLCLA